MNRLGLILKWARGDQSRVQFARKLGLSYTFVRAMEHGLRFPSDRVLLEIADRLSVDAGDLLLAAYCDRSPDLGEVLAARGVELPADEEEEFAGYAYEAPEDEVDAPPPVRPSASRGGKRRQGDSVQISRRF